MQIHIEYSCDWWRVRQSSEGWFQQNWRAWVFFHNDPWIMTVNAFDSSQSPWFLTSKPQILLSSYSGSSGHKCHIWRNSLHVYLGYQNHLWLMWHLTSDQQNVVKSFLDFSECLVKFAVFLLRIYWTEFLKQEWDGGLENNKSSEILNNLGMESLMSYLSGPTSGLGLE